MQFRVHFEEQDGIKQTKNINAVTAADASALIRRSFINPIIIHKVKIDREVHNIKRGKAHA